jgi:hypothetical protein
MGLQDDGGDDNEMDDTRQKLIGIVWLLLAATSAIEVYLGGLDSLSLLQGMAALFGGFAPAVGLLYLTGLITLMDARIKHQ